MLILTLVTINTHQVTTLLVRSDWANGCESNCRKKIIGGWINVFGCLFHRFRYFRFLYFERDYGFIIWFIAKMRTSDKQGSKKASMESLKFNKKNLMLILTLVTISTHQVTTLFIKSDDSS